MQSRRKKETKKLSLDWPKKSCRGNMVMMSTHLIEPQLINGDKKRFNVDY
jgi:hypothetical protein